MIWSKGYNPAKNTHYYWPSYNMYLLRVLIFIHIYRKSFMVVE